MSEQLKAIRRRFPWNVIVVLLGLAVGIGGLAVGLYSAFHERLPNLTYEITNEADVFDVYQPRSDLVVVFQGEDIQARNLNLRILTIRISNAGEADILQDRYDQTIPWGLQIRNGKVVEQRLLTSNSSYLMANVEPTLADENTLMFSKVIFERRKYFVVEIVVLHQKDKAPEAAPIGKIAGIETVLATKPGAEKVGKGFANQVFDGSPLVQSVRTIVYFFGAVLLLVFIVLDVVVMTSIMEKVQDARDRRARIALENRIHRYFVGRTVPVAWLALLQEEAARRGISRLVEFQELLEEPQERLRQRLEVAERWRDYETAGEAYRLARSKLEGDRQSPAEQLPGALTTADDLRYHMYERAYRIDPVMRARLTPLLVPDARRYLFDGAMTAGVLSVNNQKEIVQ